MIHSILHQIWNQRRSNGWLFAELLIVFTLMWYCVDVLYGFAHAERQPKGYDLEHVYKIRISCNPTQIVPCTSEDSLQTFWFKPMEEVLRRYLCGIAGNHYLIDMLQIIPLRLPFCMGKAIEYIHTIPHQCKYNQQLGKQPAITAALVPYLV
jgi:hypothetical protein